MIYVASTVSAKVIEDFESYSTGVLSTQGWTFNTGDGETIISINGTKVAYAYNNDYMQGSHTSRSAYGTDRAKLAKTTWIGRKISIKGITGIHVKYNAKTYGMTGGEYLFVEWSTNGTTWIHLYSGRPTTWTSHDNQCSSGAEINPYFGIRFRTNGRHCCQLCLCR